MPFEPGNELYKNRLESKGGRPSRRTEEEVRLLFDTTWTIEERVAAIQKLSQAAKRGDSNSFRLLAAYSFGTPRSGDTIDKEEAVDNAIEGLIKELKASLSEGAWAEVRRVLGVRADFADAAGDGGEPEGREAESSTF